MSYGSGDCLLTAIRQDYHIHYSKKKNVPNKFSWWNRLPFKHSNFAYIVNVPTFEFSAVYIIHVCVLYVSCIFVLVWFALMPSWSGRSFVITNKVLLFCSDTTCYDWGRAKVSLIAIELLCSRRTTCPYCNPNHTHLHLVQWQMQQLVTEVNLQGSWLMETLHSRAGQWCWVASSAGASCYFCI